MGARHIHREAADRPKDLSLRDVIIVAIATIAVILANVGVVRALDVALDALNR